MPNYNTDHKLIATHFQADYKSRKIAIQNLLLLKNSYLKNKKGKWELLVKAYEYDKLIEAGEETCARCDKVDTCFLAKNVKATHGIKFHEMRFSCFKRKEK